MEQVIFIIIAAIVGLIQFMAKRSENSDSGPSEPFKPSNPTRPSGRQRPIPTQGSEEERMRKFLEAMGLPPDAAPAPRTVQRPVQEAQEPEQQPKSPPLPQRSAPIRRAPKAMGPGRAKYAPVQPTAAAPQAAEPPAKSLLTPHEPSPAFEVNQEVSTSKPDSFPTEESPATRPSSPALPPLARLLESPENLRTAFVLKEILGTPRGL